MTGTAPNIIPYIPKRKHPMTFNIRRVLMLELAKEIITTTVATYPRMSVEFISTLFFCSLQGAYHRKVHP
jgi:hypothetical protein